MRRERERQKWEEQAEQDVGLDESTGPLHYQAVHGGEIRSHGIGYYAFSTDETKRKEQMELLDKLRNQVIWTLPIVIHTYCDCLFCLFSDTNSKRKAAKTSREAKSHDGSETR